MPAAFLSTGLITLALARRGKTPAIDVLMTASAGRGAVSRVLQQKGRHRLRLDRLQRGD